QLPRILEPARAGTGIGGRVVLLEDAAAPRPLPRSPARPTNSSWITASNASAPRCASSPLNGTDHATHREQNSRIRYIAWRNRHTADPRLRRIVKRAPQPDRALATE